MSSVDYQRTCAACGGSFRYGELPDLESLNDGAIRYVAVHAGHSTRPAELAPVTGDDIQYPLAS